MGSGHSKPAGQLSQEVRAPLETVPCWQGVHWWAPEALMEPLGQAVGPDTNCDEQKEPAVQVVHVPAPRAEYSPRAHRMGGSLALGHRYPAGHWTQAPVVPRR